MASKTKAFSKELWDGFDLVTKLTADGVHSAQEMQNFLKEVAEIEAEYSKKLIRACKVSRGEQASNKLFGTLAKSSGYGAKMVNRLKSGFRGKKEQGSLKSAWMTVIDSVEKAAKAHSQYSTDISNTIITGMAAWTKDRKAQQQAATSEGAQASREYYDAKSALARAKKNYIKLAKDLESKEASYDAAVTEGRPEAAKFITKVNALKPKVADAEADYKQATEAANRVQTQYYTKTIPVLLDNLQVFEVDRIQRLTKYLTEFTKMRKAVAKTESEIVPIMSKALGGVSADKDIAAFVDKNRTGGSLPDAFEAVAAKELSPTAVFGVSLDDVMAVQKEQAPADTKIPYVVIVLTKRIEDLGGPKTEGVFRISGSAGEVRQMRRELDKGNYGAVDMVMDVHAVAALLKQWLRDLPDPLIPSAQYNEALKVSNDSDKAIALVRNLPETNRRTLTHIMKFLATIDEDESLMSPDNLAMVFSPCLLRSPAGQGAEALLMGAGGTHAFVKTLIEHIKIKTKEGPPRGGSGGDGAGDGAGGDATTAAGNRGTWEGNGESPVGAEGAPLKSNFPSPNPGTEGGGSGSKRSKKGGGSPRRRKTDEKDTTSRSGSKGSRGSRRKKIGGSSHHKPASKPATPGKPTTPAGS